MSDVAGYFIDSVDGHSDIFVCKACVEEHGKSTERPLSVQDFVFLPMKCGFHIYGGEPSEYV